MPKAFNCTMCSAPLDLTKSDGVTVRCHYCGNSAILPEELRDVTRGRPKPSPGGTLLSIIDRGLKMAEVSQLLHAGNKIGAIKLYRETFGGSLQEAKDAVEQMERNQQVMISQANVEASGVHHQQFQVSPVMSGQIIRSSKKVARWIVLVVLLLVIVPVAIGIFFAYKAMNSHSRTVMSERTEGSSTVSHNDGAKATEPPRFASAVMEIGSEGIGAGQFKDVRSVAVDGEGRIYVVEYIGGRVQVFDPQGKFITQWMVDPKSATFDIEADRKGIVYVVQPRGVYRHNGATGEPLGELSKPPTNSYETYYDVEVGLDGSIYAISGHYNLVRINPDNTFKSAINLREKTGEDFSFDKLAVDGAGNIYVMGRSEKTIFKFAPDGRFINRFGGSGDGPGQFRTGNGIAVDGQGRVYVSDSGRLIQVFDSNGRYLDSFGGEHPVIYGMAVNDQNEIFVTERNRYKIIKYALTNK